MPYSGINDASLPDRVKEMPDKLRKLWIGAFNGIYKSKKDGGAANPEGAAMAGANKMVTQAKASASEDDEWSDEQIEALVAQELEPRPSRAYLSRLREMLTGLKGKSVDDAAITHIMRSSAGYVGGQRRQENRQQVATKTASEIVDYRVLYPLELAEVPESIQVLPTPGSYKHPKFGMIKITKQRNQHFVDNFNNGVYQDQLPIDAEHSNKLSGAFGWITKLAMNDDGSVDASVEWTDRGEEAFKKDRFKYFSPEWYEEWTDPITEETHKDILIGGAVTTRPFFKDSVLKPLVASELTLEEGWIDEEEFAEIPNELSLDSIRDQVYAQVRAKYPYHGGLEQSYYVADVFPNSAIYCGPKGKYYKVPFSLGDDGTIEVDFQEPKEVTRFTMWRAASELGGEVELTQPDVNDVHVKKLVSKEEEKQVDEKEFTEQLEAMKVELRTATEGMTTQLTEERSKREAAEERVKSLEGSLRHQRFVDIVKSGLHRWYGEVDKNVARLERFAEVYGEDSDEFKDVVSEENARAESLASSEIFKEKGDSRQPEGATEYQTALRQYREENPSKSEAEAVTAVLESSPKFYADYRRQMNQAAARGDTEAVKL